RHKYRVSIGALEEVEPALQVGMGDHEPTPEQVAAERVRTLTEELRLSDLHRQLAEDPDFPVRADHHDEELTSPMGGPEGWGLAIDSDAAQDLDAAPDLDGDALAKDPAVR
ncbi:MAG: hypothetical protein ACTHXC_12690, partial [Brachybacterium sp.]